MTAAAGGEEEGALWKTTDNKRGIPEAIFIENVEGMCKKAEPTVIITKLQELYSKYQYMQSSLVAQRSALKSKLPDIVSALDTVNHLIDRRSKAAEGETAEYTYQLSENIWSRASVAPTSNVCLWLGANVMLEYSVDEAVELLRTNEQNAKTTISTLDEDMAFLRDQITTTEVNIARTHNYNVKLRQKSKENEDPQKALPSPSAPPTSAAPISTAAPSKEIASPDGSYSWKQEGEEVEISVSVPADAAKSDIKVTILADSLRVEHSGKVLVKGELGGRCSPNGSTWTMNNGRVEVTLEKADATRWPSLFVEEV
jgi:prefoldin subunit 5